MWVVSIVRPCWRLFTSGLWQSMFNRFGTVLRFTTARNQQANGKVERQIAAIEELGTI